MKFFKLNHIKDIKLKFNIETNFGPLNSKVNIEFELEFDVIVAS